MIRDHHLEQYKITLTVETPVHIGSGHTIHKNEYALDTRSGSVYMINMPLLLQRIVEKELIGEYERLVLTDSEGMQTYHYGMYEFINKYFPGELKNLSLYTCQNAEYFRNKRNKREIKQFIRGADEKPYIPGSSIKGMIKTCLLAAMIQADRKKAVDCMGNYSEKQAGKMLEDMFFNTLDLKSNDIHNAVNSVMRAISVSDSLPIDFSNMTLCQKIDVRHDEKITNMPLLWECVCPGTVVEALLTLDTRYGQFSIEGVEDALDDFSELYDELALRFEIPENVNDQDYRGRILLGGGVGYWSKTNMYQIFEYDEALRRVSGIMTSQFKKHGHDRDEQYGVSPHTLKYTSYNNEYLPMGVCSIQFD